MNYILYDGAVREQLLPFTFTRPVADIRIGILTIREKWEKQLRVTTTTLTEEYLEAKYPMLEMDENIFIDASYIPTNEFVSKVKELQKNQAIIYGEEIIAFYSTVDQEEVDFDSYDLIELSDTLICLENKWDIFQQNKYALEQDYKLLTEDEFSQEIPEFVQAVNPENIFIEEGAVLNPCILNASDGPIYIGKNAVVLDGCIIRGPFSLGDGAVLKMGAKIYGPTTIGPKCKVGGEVKNVVFFGNSNKGHEGYLGNSVIGEWCNFGADTNSSNLKNTYNSIKIWDYISEEQEDTAQQFLGLLMGDHSKTGINTMFNTGTVVGVNANVFGAGFPDKFVPSFSWGISEKLEFKIDKALEVAKNVMALVGEELAPVDQEILEHVFELTKKYRN